MKISTHSLITTTLCAALSVPIGACDGGFDSRGQDAADRLNGETGETSGTGETGETGETSDTGDTEDTIEMANPVPWHVSIQRVGGDSPHWCSGALIREDFVLTAAHCVEGHAAASLRVVANIDRLSDPGTAETLRGVGQLIVHAGFDPQRLAPEHDLALLWLDAPLDISGPDVAPIDLAELTDIDPTTTGVEGTISGWNPLPTGEFTEELELLSPFLLSNQEARDVYGTPIVVWQLASKALENTEACQADSGSPLTIDTPFGPRLAGVASKGTSCDDPTSSQLYTRVSSYQNWIETAMGVP